MNPENTLAVVLPINLAAGATLVINLETREIIGALSPQRPIPLVKRTRKPRKVKENLDHELDISDSTNSKV